MSYATVEQLANRLGITIESGTASYDKLDDALKLATELINTVTGRVFSNAVSTETKYFTIDNYDGNCWVGDMEHAPDSVSLNNVVINAADYDVIRDNGLSVKLYSQSFSFGDIVAVVGKFQTGSTPLAVQHACLLIAQRLYKNPNGGSDVVSESSPVYSYTKSANTSVFKFGLKGEEYEYIRPYIRIE